MSEYGSSRRMLLTVKNVPNITVYVSVMKNLRMRNSKNTCRLSGWPIRNRIRNLQSAKCGTSEIPHAKNVLETPKRNPEDYPNGCIAKPSKVRKHGFRMQLPSKKIAFDSRCTVLPHLHGQAAINTLAVVIIRSLKLITINRVGWPPGNSKTPWVSWGAWCTRHMENSLKPQVSRVC